MLHIDAISSLDLLTIDPLPSPSRPHRLSKPSTISHLLQTYSSVFSSPHGLPPHRPHNHHIPLIPHSSPINIKPYRYPHAHKHTMTSLIQEMLNEGIIRPAQAPFLPQLSSSKRKMAPGIFVQIIKA